MNIMMGIINKVLSKRIISNIAYSIYLFTNRGRKCLETFNNEVKKYKNIPSNKSCRALFLDYVFVRRIYGATATDYLLYSFYDKSEQQINEYITEKRRCEMYDYADDKSFNHIMGNKKDFYSEYSRYMHSDVLFIDSELDYHRFIQLCANQEYVIIKPRDGQRGIGVEKVLVNNDNDRKKVWKKCLQDHLVVERVLKNDSLLASFHPASLNSIRISTVMDLSRNVHVLAATLRTGAGNNVVDNGHYGGVYAAIDIKSGKVCTDGYNMVGECFKAHPDTGKIFRGTVIPKWDELCKLVIEIAALHDELRYIGWDFVLTEEGKWVLIEGNEPGGIDIHQQPLGYGLYSIYAQYIYGKNENLHGCDILQKRKG